MKIVRTSVGLFRHDDDGKCQTCGLFDAHGNNCIDGAPYRQLRETQEQLADAMRVVKAVRFACFEGAPMDVMKNVSDAGKMADELLRRIEEAKA